MLTTLFVIKIFDLRNLYMKSINLIISLSLEASKRNILYTFFKRFLDSLVNLKQRPFGTSLKRAYLVYLVYRRSYRIEKIKQ